MTKLSYVLLFVAASACDSNPNVPPPKPGTTQAAQATGAAPGPHGATPGGQGKAKDTTIVWKAPDAWKLLDHPSPMRLATYTIPKAEGDAEDAELSVTRVGGDVASNIQRWSGQFEGSPQPKTSERSAGDLKITVVELEGTYSGMAMPGQGAAGPKQNFAMLAAIVEGGGDAHFFKMTGPKKTIDAARGGFDELVSSFGKR